MLDITCSLLTHAPFRALATEPIILMASLQLVTFATAPPFLLVVGGVLALRERGQRAEKFEPCLTMGEPKDRMREARPAAAPEETKS